MDKKVYQYISQQTNDPIVELKTCVISGKEFAVFQSDLDFYTKISPVFDGQKFQVPTPQLCPEERQRRRLAWRNERNFYKATCAISGKTIISNYDPANHTIISNPVRRSDKRDPLSYQQDIDRTQGFFRQFALLRQKIPKIALMSDNNVGSTNCEYCYDILQCKDSYLTNETFGSEQSFYCTEVSGSSFIADSFIVYHSQYCYACMDSRNLYDCMYVHSSSDCSRLSFAFDCKNCQDCIACVGLRNQQYCLYNQQYTAQEFAEKKKEFLSALYTDPDTIHTQRRQFLDTKPRPATNQVNTDNCIGNNVFSSQNMVACFDMKESKDCKYFTLSSGAKDCMDVSICMPKGWCYDSTTPDNSWRVAFSLFAIECSDSYYLENCYSCKDCFACIGLRHRQYCIFNKQYTKEEYHQTVAALIVHMQKNSERGEFCPVQESSFAYNISDAMQRFPLSKEETAARGYFRDDTEIKINIPDNATTIDAAKLDSDPKVVSDSIVDQVLICSETGRPFRVLKQELALYRKIGNPLPTQHHDIRYKRLVQGRPDRDLFVRTCSKTGKEILSVYPQNVVFPVRSADAYTQHIYN